MKKFPDDNTISKPVIPFMVESLMKGTHNFSIYEVKNGKLEDAIDVATKRMLEFSKMGGIKYKIRYYLSASEAMKSINLSMPS